MINIEQIFSTLAHVRPDSSQVPISVQRGNDFVHDINIGLSRSFRFSGNGQNGEQTIVHDPNQFHFFSQERQPRDPYSCTEMCLADTRVFGETPFVENSQPLDLKVDCIDELRRLKEEFLTRPFMMEVFFKGHRKSGNTRYLLPRECYIVTVNPGNPEVHQVLESSFDKAIECMERGKNFAIEISVYDAVKGWLQQVMYKSTGHYWSFNNFGMGERWHIYNNSPRIICCGNDKTGLRLFCALCFCLLPFWCCSYTAYRAHRGVTCKTMNPNLDLAVFYKGILM
ncbi:uncharacterized protein [Clytia hemisphaerica]|uniref:Uncharacterized protein n=1 Tax=Clytia hemisphaerica TaxID=252671 RepID=A0A7M5U2I0_9CNID